MSSLRTLPLFERLEGCRNVLVAGGGGGFDVYAGLPLAFALASAGATVHLANLSFSALDAPESWIAPGLAEVRAATPGAGDYFPERTLARWLSARGHDQPVYAFARTGVLPLRESYRLLADRLELDAVVLVDGGTDILMRGDESRIGTPEEDMASLAAVRDLTDVPVRIVTCLGFGIDYYHGVSHALVLENIAALIRSGHYLGAFSIPPDSPEALAYLDAVDHARRTTPTRPSIVNGQIAAAIRGEVGNSQFTTRTAGSDLFINPLMEMYFSFDLEGLAQNVAYLDALADTRTRAQVSLAIETYRYDIDEYRAARPFPH